MYIIKIHKVSFVNILFGGLTFLLFLLPSTPFIINIFIYLSLLYGAFNSYYYTKTIGLFHLLTLFNLIFAFFYFSKGFLHILNFIEFAEAFKFYQIFIDLDAQKNLIFIPFIALITVNFSYFLFKTPKQNRNSKTISFLKPSLLVFLMSAPLSLYKQIKQFLFILNNGYLSIYDGSLSLLNFNPIINLSGYFNEFSYVAFVATSPPKKRFVLVSAAFLLIRAFDLFSGRRGQFMVLLLFVLWYTNKNYFELKINGYRFFTILLFIIPIFLIRNFVSVEAAINNEAFIQTFLAPFTNTHLILAYVLKFGFYKFYEYPILSLLAPFQLLSFAGQTHTYLEKTWGLGHHLTHYLNPDLYYAGQGIGSSFLVELYSAGPFGIIIGCVILGYVISKTSRQDTGTFFHFFSFYIVTHILFISRTSFFIPIFKPLIYLIIFIPFLFILDKILWKKNLH